jgi:hypothetical protein
MVVRERQQVETWQSQTQKMKRFTMKKMILMLVLACGSAATTFCANEIDSFIQKKYCPVKP